MIWQDKGYLLNINRYNENSSIAEFYTKKYGKVSGIIFGSTSKKTKSYLMLGNNLHINFSSKDNTSIGNFKIEINKVNTPIYFNDRLKLTCIIYSMQIIRLLSGENQTNESIYLLIDKLFELIKSDNWIQSFIFWELSLFKNLGYEINFEDFSILKENNDKSIHVSKTDNAKIIPAFLINKSDKVNDYKELVTGLNLVGDFLEKSILQENNTNVPYSRNEFISLIEEL